MHIAICTLESLSAYMQSKFYDVPKRPDETDGDFEKRTWREKSHYDRTTGQVFIPGAQFQNSLKEAAKYISDDLVIEGAGKARYTKNFEAGILVQDNLMLDVCKDDLDSNTLFCNPQGKRGPGTRVPKTFPLISHWKGEVNYLILDDKIPKDVFERVLGVSGSLIGIGAFRPRNWGTFGRFHCVNIEWKEVDY